MRSRSHQEICRIPVIAGVGARLTGMTIHRLMTAMATEQGLPGDEQVVETTPQTTDDRSDAAAEQ